MAMCSKKYRRYLIRFILYLPEKESKVIGCHFRFYPVATMGFVEINQVVERVFIGKLRRTDIAVVAK